MVKTRQEVAKDDQWAVEALYPSLEQWQTDFDAAARQAGWNEIISYKGRLHEGSTIISELLDKLFFVSRKLHNLYVYAHLRHDEDLTNDSYKRAYSQITSALHDFHQAVAWFEPEILSISDPTLKQYLDSSELAEKRFYLEKIIRLKPHTLSKEKEELLALAGKALQAPHKAFAAINDADFKFGSVLDSNNQEHELTHGLYQVYLRTHDQVLRKNSFLQLHKRYAEYENTLCELLNGQIQAHLFNARSRNYSSCLEAALFPKNIDTNVYHALIKAVNEGLPELHRYIELRKSVLKLETLHVYDLFVPLTKEVNLTIPYEDAVIKVLDSVQPLGKEYQNILNKGFKEDRWVDRYENANKRSGAYSSGSYDSRPYILMNYRGTIRDLFTLTHEAGHSMHSYYSHKYQPYHYSDYPIFLAEVASTFNEHLLTNFLLQNAQSNQEKIYLLTQSVEDIRGTLFRQTMFAEFELKLHEMAEQNIPITPKLLKQEFQKLNEKYFGPSITLDQESEIEWARIPHFYYNFYVFQYATGISAAMALAEKVTQGGTKERDAYLNFLKGGSSKYPIDMLKEAGVDMSSSLPVQETIKTFGRRVRELEKLVKI